MRAGRYAQRVDDLGPPIAYLALEDGTPVYDRSGERIGVAEQVVADEQADIFDGVIVHTLPLPGRHLFADVDQIAELRERGVVLSVDGDALREPSEQSGTPRKKQSGSGDKTESALQARLRHAWDWIRRSR
jgi:uncharacterized protein YrrD